MKTTKLLSILALSLFIFGQPLQAQLNQIKNAKDKVTNATSGKKDKDKDSDLSENSEQSSNKSKMEEQNQGAEKATKFEAGKGYFYTSFKPTDYKTEVSVGDELYVRMELGKTMYELMQDAGLDPSFSAYGFVTVYIDGNKQFMTGPYTFQSNMSKVWTFINIPLNVKPDFIEKVSSDQSMLETDQDIWVFQQLFQEGGIITQYTTAAIKSMSSGSHKVKVEFGLAKSSSEENPQMVACTGEVTVKADAAGAEQLAESGPKNLRPLKEEEKGKFVFGINSYTPGNGELKVTWELPQAPKYYNMKWCKATSCDYDHGNINFYVSVDGQALSAWSAQLWDADYETLKSFDMVLLPASDKGYGSLDAGFNSSKLFKDSNPVVYALLDLLYGGKLSVGKHTLKIKAYSQECVPYDVDYEFQDSYFAQWPAIAETTIELNVTQDGLNKLIASSDAKPLSHAGGEWAAVDAKLLSNGTGVGDDAVMVDIATQTEWKVVTNSLGEILYRTCKADVVYKCQYGVRLQKNLVVREDYMGGGTYGQPYLSERVEFSFGPSLMNTMHLPVPLSKVQ